MSDAPRAVIEISGAGSENGPSTAGWYTEDGNEAGFIYLTPSGGLMRGEAKVPRSVVHFVVAGWDDSGREGRAKLDFSDGQTRHIAIPLVAGTAPRRRTLSLRTRNGIAAGHAVVELPLDGTQEGARDRLLNPTPLQADDSGRVSLAWYGDRELTLAISLPLANEPSLARIAAGDRTVRLEDIIAVSCSFRCVDGSEADYAGFTAAAELSDGSVARFEIPQSDHLSRGNRVLAWPRGAEKVHAAAPHFGTATLRSPTQPCVLVRPCDR